VNNHSIKLRDYQKECLEAIKLCYKTGIRRQLICLPTGTGKTIIFAQFPNFFGMKKRMLVLAHREELLNQAREKILRANSNLKVDIEQAERQADDSCDVVVASVQTLGRQNSKRLQRLNPNQFYLIVVDEAHHAIASTYHRILKHFKIFDENTRKLLVGFTATPKRGDRIGLDAVFEEITFSRSMPDMIEKGYLAPLAAFRIETDIDLSDVKTRMGDFVTGQLSKAVNIHKRNDIVIKVYQEHLKGRQTICFCVDVAHANSLAETFRKNKIATASVTGEMDRDKRAKALADFQTGKKQVLTNCMVLTEGYDESSISGIILARPTKSSLLYTQMIGRGTRLHPGKENVTVIDIVDVTKNHKLINLSTLFGLPKDFNLEGRTTSEVHEAIRWVEANRPWVQTDLATSLSDLRYKCQKVNLFDMQTPPELIEISDFAWTQISPNRYKLHIVGGEHITVSQNILDDWEAVIQKNITERVIARSKSLKSSIKSADDFISIHRKESKKLVYRYSPWRQQPISEKQIKILKKRGITVSKKLTKGQASHIISMLITSQK
jgi:superfamily II DNA or RNA helicase